MNSQPIPLQKLKPRSSESHKGTYGRVLVVAGARGMAGAASLAGTGAVLSGAGLVSVAVPDCCLETVAQFNPCYMTIPLPHDSAGRITADARTQLRELSASATSIGIGPGLSRSEAIPWVVESLYRNYRGPMVVDADALNALANSTNGLSDAAGPRILTPHIGEFRRLVNDPDLSVELCRVRAIRLAKRFNVIVVLKGHRSLVTDGEVSRENETGNPGMASGGSGDVLTGVLSALLSQDLSPLEAAVLGTHVHGLAGDIGSARVGEISLNARVICDCLPDAWREVSREAM